MQQLRESASYIQDQTGNFQPEFGIILGTGLGALIKEIEIEHSLDYADIPHFPVSTVESHTGRLAFGTLAGRRVMVMQGRFHFYEGYTMQQVVHPVRVMKLLGVNKLFISNASGGLNPAFNTSDLMVITDHINLIPDNPLAGSNDERVGPRFPSMRGAYAPRLREALREAARKTGVNLAEGIYAAYPGPSFETPAEIRALRVLGADAVGMSTAPETILARHCGLEVAALSVITNLAEGLSDETLSHSQTLAAASRAAGDLAEIVETFSSLLAST